VKQELAKWLPEKNVEDSPGKGKGKGKGKRNRKGAKKARQG